MKGLEPGKTDESDEGSDNVRFRFILVKGRMVVPIQMKSVKHWINSTGRCIIGYMASTMRSMEMKTTLCFYH
jgi:hypothetical protein